MRSMMRGCSASTMHEDAGRDALADGEVDDALLVEDAAVGLGDQHLDHLVAVGVGAVHAGHVGDEAGGVGDGGHLDHGLGAIDELDQHARVHVPARRLPRDSRRGRRRG